MSDRRAFVAGNWKMHGLQPALGELEAVASGLGSAGCDVMICPPAHLVRQAAEMATGTDLAIGAQDCHTAEAGAHTGDISAEMLADAGATAVILGHSERRADHGDTDALVAAKVEAAWRAGLTAIVCIGETLGQREYGVFKHTLERQVRRSVPDGATGENTVIAYEPVWAIGTGLTPSVDDIADAHGHVRAVMAEHLGQAVADQIRIQYGGSVKPANAAELMAVSDVDGALVGGASLKAEDFLGIISAYA